MELSGALVEQIYIRTVRGVAEQVSIPVAAKIGSSFGSLGFVTKQLVESGAKALVLFNRFWAPDIDIDKLRIKAASPFSQAIEMHLSLRWIGLLHGDYPCDLAATTGIHEAEQVVKQLLAGATVTQVCSTVYRNGFGQIGTILAGLEAWMARHDFQSVSDFRGKLSERSAKDAALYERQQYIKHLTEIS